MSGPIVCVVVADGGIIGGPCPAGIADKLKQTDGAGAVLVQPEERPHEVLGTARPEGIEVLTLYPQGLGNLVQQLPPGDTVVRFVLGDTVIRSLFLKADSQPQFLPRTGEQALLRGKVLWTAGKSARREENASVQRQGQGNMVCVLLLWGLDRDGAPSHLHLSASISGVIM